jgi:hypothetical protein
VNCICPSFTQTALLDEVMNDKDVAMFVKMVGIVE